MQHGALVELMAIVAPALEGRIEVGKPNLGKKSERAKIHTQNRRARGSEDARDGEERAIAAQHDHQRWFESWQIVPVMGRGVLRVLGRLEVQERLVVMLAQPCDELRQKAAELLLARFADNGDAIHAVPVYPNPSGAESGLACVQQKFAIPLCAGNR